jgi:hypothetical protein
LMFSRLKITKSNYPIVLGTYQLSVLMIWLSQKLSISFRLLWIRYFLFALATISEITFRFSAISLLPVGMSSILSLVFSGRAKSSRI